tara:strand:- start:133991 stop:134905 length:915 start_codon:yes stop_codon:yes gene_type:complete
LKSKKFENQSYDSHRSHFDDYAEGGAQAEFARSWLDADTVDAWRHQRIYRVVEPLINEKCSNSWLTVGDGRYGLDAQFLSSRECQVTASDISGLLLEEAYEQELLKDFSVENAEELSFSDEQFDFVFCKDAFHHFPRPIKALYELLRVSKRGVILIEPSDHVLQGKLLDRAYAAARKFVGGIAKKSATYSTDYEESGNYVYRISKREMEKIALGLNYPIIAFKGINDYFEEGMIREPLHIGGPLLRRAKVIIRIMDILSKLRLRDYRLISVVFLKDGDNTSLVSSLLDAGYEVKQLTRNPYLPT